MNYIQRNANGDIVGLFLNPQGDPTIRTDPEPLPDDHPDVVAFVARLAAQVMVPISAEDIAAVLPADQQAALTQRLATKGVTVATFTQGGKS